MSILRNATLPFLSLGLLLAGATEPRAADPRPTSGSDRLFQAFAEEAALIQTQWWEGQVAFTDNDPTDSTVLRLVAAVQPFQNVEFGGRVGFGSTDAPGNIPDGSGATDLDLWGKWGFAPSGGETEFAVGALVTVPTGDDTAGLGRDAFDFEVFGSLRHRLPKLVVSAYGGFRVNGNGSTQGFTVEGKTSALLGGGVIVPVSDALSWVGEVNLESERFRGGDSDFRVLGGVNWRVTSRGIVRGAISVGLTDGSPDAALTGGYAYTF